MSIKHFARLFPLVLFFLLPSLSSAATESIRIIRQDCTGYSNCYTSLSAWEAAENRDLTATDEIAVARIEGTWTNPDTTAVTIDGWTTDATRYVKIYTTPEARHMGKWDVGKYRLEINSALPAIKISESYVRVEGIQIDTNDYGIYIQGGISSSDVAGVTYVSHNIIKNHGTGSGKNGYNVYYVAPSTHHAYNNIVYGFSSFSGEGMQNEDVDATAYFYNNTVYGNYRGIQQSLGTVVVVNNIAYENSIIDFNGTFNALSNYNFSKDTTAPGTNSIHGTAVGKTLSFIAPDSGNFHLSSSDTGAKDYGVDLSTDPNLPFSTDIDGETRSGAWDIGADETSGGGTPPAPNTTTPSIPTNLLATVVSSSQVNLTWTASTDNTGVTGYRIYRDGNQIATSVSTSYSDINLTASTLYSYTVVAYDAAGNTSSQSTSASATTQAGLAPDTTAPSIPTNLTASAISSSQINLSWTASTDAVGVTGYTIYRNGTQLTTTTGTTYSNTGLSASTLYAYTVSAYDLAGNASSQSSGASATTQASTVVTTTTTGAPIIFYTDITSGPNTGGENNNGAYLSIFGKNFGTNISNVKVSVGNGEVVRYIYLGASLGRPDVQQLSVQLGPNTTTGAIKVTVGGVDSNADQVFTVRAGDFYYVSKTGSDTIGMVNDINRPYRTANYVMALSAFADNDFMVIRGGNYDISTGQENLYNNRWLNLGVGQGGSLRSGTSDVNRITIYGYPGENTIIDWGNNTAGNTFGIRTVSSTSYYTMANLNFDLKNSGGGAIFLGFYSTPTAYCNYCNVINIKVSGGMAGALSGVSSAYFHRVDNLKLYGFNIGNQSSLADPALASHVIYLSHFYNNADIGWIYVHDNAYGRAALQVAGDNWGTDRALAWGVNANVRIHDSLFKNLAQEAILFNLGSKEIFIYNNIIDNVVTRNNAFAAVAFRGADLNAGDYYFYNNTVYTDATGGQDYNGIIQMGYSPQTTYPRSVNLDSNIIYSKSTSSNFYSINHSSFTTNKVTSNNNIWFNSAQSLPFMGANDRIINPQLTAPSSNDFTLQSISSAINAGSSLVSSLVTKDYFGISRPQGSAYDIGAFEYCTNCTTTTTTTQPTGDTTAPSVPTNLLATVVSPSQVNLTWSASTDNTGVTGYRIYRNGTQLTTTTGTSYQNTGLSAATLYTYTVSAYDAAGNVSSQSTGASATTQNQPVADTTAPAITNIASSGTTTGATISWTTNEAGTSRVEYGPTTSYGNTTPLTTTPSTSHSHTISNLSSNTTYHYRVTTTDSAGNTATSQDRTFTTSSVADTTAPSSITDLTTSSLGQTSLTLSWTVPTDTSGIASYDIRYSTTPITSTTFSSATQLTNVPLPTTSGSTQTQYVSVGLTPNTTYFFAIKSTDAVGNVSSLSNIATGTTLSAPTTTSTTASTQTGTISVPTVSSGGGGGGSFTIYQLSDITPPKNPTNVRIEPTNTQATLSWTNPTDPDFVRVKIVRKTGSAVSSHTDGTTVYDGTGTTFTDTNLVNNQTYYYAIYAYDKVPNYTSTLGLSATPQASLTQRNVSYTTIEAGCTETTTYSTLTGAPCTKVPTAFRPFYTFSKDRAITYGMKDSTDVRELQKILQFEGLLTLTSPADGAFGPGTKSAIIAFQKKYAITPAQGTVGPLTKTKLNQLYGSTTISTTFYRNLTIGSKGEDVKKLQQLLNTDIATRITSTGAGSPGNETTYFGAATKAAVMKYQKKNNISPASGYVGPVTRGKLEGR